MVSKFLTNYIRHFLYTHRCCCIWNWTVGRAIAQVVECRAQHWCKPLVRQRIFFLSQSQLVFCFCAGVPACVSSRSSSSTRYRKCRSKFFIFCFDWMLIFMMLVKSITMGISVFTVQGLGTKKHTFSHVHRKKHVELLAYIHAYTHVLVHAVRSTRIQAHMCVHMRTHTHTLHTPHTCHTCHTHTARTHTYRTRTHVRTHTHTHTYTHTIRSTLNYSHTCMHVLVHAVRSTMSQAHICACTCARTHTLHTPRTHTHTHKHTHTVTHWDHTHTHIQDTHTHPTNKDKHPHPNLDMHSLTLYCARMLKHCGFVSWNQSWWLTLNLGILPFQKLSNE